jgi:hypothetical protein
LKESVQSRLLDSRNVDLAASIRVFDKKPQPENMNPQLTFGENDARTFLIMQFADFVNVELKLLLKNSKSAVSATPISSGKYEREFSQMNLIVSPTRALLITKNIFSTLS